MKQIKEWLAGIKNDRKLRCGGYAVVLTVIVAALTLLLGALADSIETRFALQTDLSYNELTTQGAVTKAVLSQLDREVQIIAVMPVGGGDETLLSLLNRYEASSSLIAVSRDSLLNNPALQTRFADTAGKGQVSSDCVIVYCPATARVCILDEEDYVHISYNLETERYETDGYSYEKALTEAIVYVTQDEVPVIQFLTGHGEVSGDALSPMQNTLIEANYEVRSINLAAGDVLDPESPLAIMSPRYDWTDWELERIVAYANEGGSFLIVSLYSDPLSMRNYQAFLRSYGFEAYPGMVIAKEEDKEGYFGDYPIILMPEMQVTDATRSLLSSGEDFLLFSAARAFRLPQQTPEGVMLSPVLMTRQCYIRNLEDGLSVSDQQPTDEEGVFCVALWSDKMYENGAVSHALILGDMTLFVDPFMQESTSSTPFLLQMLHSLQDQDPVNLDILPKTAQRQGLTSRNLTPAMIVTIMLPLLVVLGAALVLWPRRNL